MIRFPAVYTFLALAIFISGCAEFSLPGGPGVKKPAGPAAAPEPVIREIHSKTFDDKTVITIKASAPFHYITYKLRDPDRVAVEIASAKVDAGPSLIVGDKLVGNISILKFKRSRAVRLEIGLRQDCDFMTTMDGHSLDVTLTPAINPELELAKKRIKEDAKRITALNSELLSLKKKITGLKEPGKSDEKIVASLKDRDSGKEKAAIVIVEPNDDAAGSAIKLNSMIKESLNGWLESWEAMDIERYGGYYSENFFYKNKNKESWLAYKAEKFKNSKTIDVIMKDLKMSVEGKRAEVEFTQIYKSNKYKDVGVKKLIMALTQAGWKIESESWRRTW